MGRFLSNSNLRQKRPADGTQGSNGAVTNERNNITMYDEARTFYPGVARKGDLLLIFTSRDVTAIRL